MPYPQAVVSFNPRTPYGVRPPPFGSNHIANSVSIHALHTECDQNGAFISIQSGGFNPRTPYGVRRAGATDRIVAYVFQSTHSIRSATKARQSLWPCLSFQSTHSIRSATFQRWFLFVRSFVSIHALHTECDNKLIDAEGYTEVSIHALHTECDVVAILIDFAHETFQSTHSIRSATHMLGTMSYR